MKRLIDIRKRHDKTQEEVASLLNITRSTYSRYETGDREPDFKTLIKLAEIFNTSTSYLMGETDDPAPPKTRIDTPTIEKAAEAIKATLYNILEREPTESEFTKFKEFAELFIKGLDKNGE